MEQKALGGARIGAKAAWSWILGHLPVPDDIDLHIACPVNAGPWKARTIKYQGATFHLVRCAPGRVQTGFLLDPLFFSPVYRSIKPDVVHGWGTEDSYSITARFLAPKSHVVQVQGLINAYSEFLPKTRTMQYVAFRESRTLRAARHVFVESAYSGEISKPFTGPHTRIHLVDHPLRENFLTADLPESRPDRALFLGSLTERKGYVDAIRAFAEAAPATWSLTVIGGGNAADTACLHREVEAGGIKNRFRHIPSADTATIIGEMQEAVLFLLPTRMDTGPTALKEAMAMGLWPVCYDNSGPREYIRRFEFGTLAANESLPDLTARLREACESRPWGGKATTAATRVRSELGHTSVWNQLRKTYSVVLNQP